VNSHTSKRFRALLASLPADVRRQALKAYRLFEVNPGHPSLHFELIDPKLGLWSARVNEGYRVLGTRQGAEHPMDLDWHT